MINNVLLIAATLILLCVFLNKFLLKMGIPVLLGFIALGMLVGKDGIFAVEFTDYTLVGDVCTFALIFIMFYGGFSTNIKHARPVLKQATLLASLGVFLTAILTALFCHLILSMPWVAAFLLGSVIASTDAASVFSILRSQKMNLKFNTASLLEVESGSNDPAAYMLTMLTFKFANGEGDLQFVLKTVLLQILVAIILAVLISKLASLLLNRMQFATEGFDLVFIMGIAIASYALPSALGGNGYLSTYICGILLGNQRLRAKRELVSFFAGVTGLMQITIFFLLGLLASPAHLRQFALEGLVVMLIMTFIVRPLVVWGLMAPFKAPTNQLILLSVAGLRGAASIVFAIMVIMHGEIGYEIFHITFLVVLFSLTLQGILLPKVARMSDMIEQGDVMKTFTDYALDLPVQFLKFRLPEGHAWIGQKLANVTLPPKTLIVYLENSTGVIVPNGETVLASNDKLILAAVEPHKMPGVNLSEIEITKGHEYVGQEIKSLNRDNLSLIVLIKREDDVLIPNGDTVIQTGDVLICNQG